MPKINTAYVFDVGLTSQADTKLLQANPTLATGDVKVSIDEGAFANLATLPTVTPASGRNVKVSLSAAEMNGSRISVQFVDAAGAEWCDLLYAIETSVEDLTPTTIADGLLNRDMDAVTVTNSRSPINALRFNRNKFTVVGTTLTVYEEDDTTVAWTATMSGSAATSLGLDPA